MNDRDGSLVAQEPVMLHIIVFPVSHQELGPETRILLLSFPKPGMRHFISLWFAGRVILVRGVHVSRANQKVLSIIEEVLRARFELTQRLLLLLGRYRLALSTPVLMQEMLLQSSQR